MPITNRSPVGPLPGTVAHFAASSTPAGWLKCNGATVSRTAYAALFSAIGTTYGVGDGATTFALPDLRGEFLRGLDDGRGIDVSRAIGSAQTDAMQGHKHESAAYSSGGINPYGQGGSPGTLGAYFSANTLPSLLSNTPYTDGSNGTPRTASESRPRNVAMLACIKF